MMTSAECRRIAERYRKRAEHLRLIAKSCYNANDLEQGAKYEHRSIDATKLYTLYSKRARQR